jgi:GTP cyclohydrolase-4
MPDLTTVYLGLGSNLGNRRENLDRALGYLTGRMKVKGMSSVYETDPVDNARQPKFLNMACEVVTMLSPEGLLALSQGIERKLGRLPVHEKNGPRTMDIDILFFGEIIIRRPDLVIPHPRFSKRAFVLVPLNEIAPDLVDPASGKTIRELLNELEKGVQGVFKTEGFDSV